MSPSEMTCKESNNHDDEVAASGGVSSLSSLQIGTPVWIKRKGHDAFTEEGVVAYLGLVKFAPGDDWVGVQLKGASARHGKNSGTVNGTSYFETSIPNSGIFVRKDHVSLRVSPASRLSAPSPKPSICVKGTPATGPGSPAKIPRNMCHGRNSQLGLRSPMANNLNHASDVFAKERKRLEEMERKRLEDMERKRLEAKALREERARQKKAYLEEAQRQSPHRTLLGLTVTFNAACEEVDDYSHHDHHPPQPDRHYSYAAEVEHEIEFDEQTGDSTIETIHKQQEESNPIPDDDFILSEGKPIVSPDEDASYIYSRQLMTKPKDTLKPKGKVEEEVRECLKVIDQWRSERFAAMERIAFQRVLVKPPSEENLPHTAPSKSSPIRIPAGWRIPIVNKRASSIDSKENKEETETAPNTPDSTAASEIFVSLHRQESNTTPFRGNLTVEGKAKNSKADDEEILFADNMGSSLFHNGSISPQDDSGDAKDEDDEDGNEIRDLDILRTDLAHAELVYNQSGDVHDLDAILESSTKRQQEGSNFNSAKHSSTESDTSSSSQGRSGVTSMSCFLSLVFMYCIFLMAFLYLCWSQKDKCDEKTRLPRRETQVKKKFEREMMKQHDEPSSRTKLLSLKKKQKVFSKIKHALLSFSQSRSINKRLGRPRMILHEYQPHEDSHCSSSSCERISSSVSGQESDDSNPQPSRIQ